MERLLVIVVDEMMDEDSEGIVLRHHRDLYQELLLLCPFTELVRYGVLALPLRGPSRYLGGEDVVITRVRDIVQRVCGSTPRLGVAEGLFAAYAAARCDQGDCWPQPCAGHAGVGARGAA